MDKAADIPLIGMARVKSVHPKKFGMWLFIVSVLMLFAALTSAYVVKKADGDWLIFEFPKLFITTSIIIVISSITMQLAYWNAKKNNLLGLRINLALTAALAIAFVVGQWYSWEELVAQDVYWVGNVAGSFIYLFTGLHGLHLLGGLIFLSIVLINAFKYKVHSKSMTQIEMCATYWHFLGGLWLYLYLFLFLNN